MEEVPHPHMEETDILVHLAEAMEEHMEMQAMAQIKMDTVREYLHTEFKV
jgi:hypothetical protein